MTSHEIICRRKSVSSQALARACYAGIALPRLQLLDVPLSQTTITGSKRPEPNLTTLYADDITH